MSNKKDEPTEKAKPNGNPNSEAPVSPDVKQEGWSAEEIAEQGAHKDATEVKEEMKQGQQTQREQDPNS
ncbi:MAG: hypothetical protein ABIP14_15715 [Blastocatellia bacterium]